LIFAIARDPSMLVEQGPAVPDVFANLVSMY
jgi:hypothetical protein